MTPKYHIGDFVKIANADKIRASHRETWHYEQVKCADLHAKVKGFRCVDNRIYYILDGIALIPMFLWSEEILEPTF